MLDPWIGSVGMQPIGIEAVKKYEKFLRPIDVEDLLPKDIYSHLSGSNWREADLGTILDFNLISIFGDLKARVKQRLNVVEVGGGYGRLAEMFLNKLQGRMHYVLIDAVPGSLMYSFLYLRSQFPELTIGSYYAGDQYSKKYDCYITSSWRTDILESEDFDLLVNIESMQEMRQDQVDFYLCLFEKLGREKSLIYLSNARDYIFKGDFHIPYNWQTLYLNNTPRSWSADHPTHILKKRHKNSCWVDQRNAHEQAFINQIVNWNNSVLLDELRLHINDRDRICGELRSKLDNITSHSEIAGFNIRSPNFNLLDDYKLSIKRMIRKFISFIL